MTECLILSEFILNLHDYAHGIKMFRTVHTLSSSLMRPYRAYFLLTVLLLLLSCGKEQQPEQEAAAPALTVLIGTDGFGDGC